MKKLYLLFLLFFVISAHAQLTVNNTAQTPAQLVQNVLVGNGVTPFNIKFNGLTSNANAVRDQVGEFVTNFNPTNLGLDRGLIMTTGNAQVAIGPNNSGSASLATAFPVQGDVDLALLSGQTIRNVAVLEFDFVATGPNLRFDFVFASEEYPVYVNNINDSFGFFLSGPGISGPFSGSAKNIAIVPSTSIPISINTVNNGSSNNGPCVNCAYYYNNLTTGQNPTTWNPAYSVQYNGFTKNLSAQSQLLCGETYHIKLAIGNASDNLLDSGVFLKDFKIEPLVLTDISGADSYIGCEGPVTINSGISPVGNTFVWTHDTNVMTGVNTPSITVTQPGVYQLSVYNSTGCLIAQDDFTVIYYSNPLVEPLDLIACTTASGPPYTYNLNQNTYMLNGQNASDFSIVYHSGSATGPIIPNGSLATYSSAGAGESIWVVIEDLNNTGCTFEASFLLNTVAGPSGSFSYSSAYCESITAPQPVTLNALTSGGVFSATPAGLIIDPSTGAIIPNGSTPNTYIVHYDIVASGSCPAYSAPTFSVTINPAPTAPVVTVVQPTCTVATGSITVTSPLGAGYEYSVDNGANYQSNPAFLGLPPGSYTVIVRDISSSCVSPTFPVTINTPPGSPSAPAYTVTHPTCAVATGSITITGVAGETYSFDGGAYSATLTYTGLAAGSSHTITAQNASGCISSVTTVTINAQPTTPSAPTATPTHPTCTVATGSITITGVAGETYSVDSGAYSATLIYTGLAAGNHTVTAQNAAGCISSVTTVTINAQPATPSAPTATPTHPTCTVATGSITITGVAGETYSVDSGAYSATLIYTGLAAGNHTVTAQNASGCISSVTTVTINAQPTTPSAPTATPTHPTCTVATGSITITGVSGETYSVDSGAYSATLIYTGLAAGNHTVTAQNASGCISSVTTVTINAQPVTPSAPTATPTHPTCTVATGSITITGVSGETYSVDSGAYSATLTYTGLAAGNHTVTAQNASGCISSVTTVIINAQPTTPSAPTATPTHPTCTVATGSITITGVAGETYSFDGGAYSTTLIYTGLAAGSSHTIIAQNASGCISSVRTVTINAQPATPSAPTATPTHPTCTVATGSITITGVSGETYSVDSGAYLATLTYTGLAAGNHTVTAQNAAGCISTVTTVTINAQPPSPSMPVVVVTHPTCTVATGSITITGVAGETYSFDGGAYLATLTYTGLAAGNHTVTAQNAAGCISPIKNITINVQPTTPSAPTATPTHPTCAVATGSITITGVAGETYSFDGGAYLATLTYTGLAGGSSHTIKAKNASGCISATTSITINPTPSKPATPMVLGGNVCVNGTISLSTPTVAGATYSWTGPNGFTSTQQNPTIVNATQAMSGTYSVIISLTLDCPSDPGTVNIIVEPNPVVTLVDGFICVDPITQLPLSGSTYTINTNLSATNYSFQWTDSLGAPVGNGSSYVANAPGVYTVVVTSNATGCSSDPTPVTVGTSSGPDSLEAVVSEYFADVMSITAIATPAGNYEYSLDGGAYQSSNVFVDVSPGPHTVTARDVNGCGNPVSITRTLIDYPRYFTPNGDGYHDTWNISALQGQSNSKIHIFDRFGKLLKEIRPSSSGWNGTFNGQDLPSTDYWFVVFYQEKGQNKEFKSHFSLKR